jgi:hypothetical protein
MHSYAYRGTFNGKFCDGSSSAAKAGLMDNLPNRFPCAGSHIHHSLLTGRRDCDRSIQDRRDGLIEDYVDDSPAWL